MEDDQSPENAAERASERRAGPRFEVDDDASLLLVNDGRLVRGRVLDLSLKGCRLRTKDRYSAGAGVRVEVTFRVNGIAFRLFGVTEWTNDWNVVGIQFIEVPQRRLRDLAEVVGEVEEEAASRAEMQVMAGQSCEPDLVESTTVEQAEENGEKQAGEQAPEKAFEQAPEQARIHVVPDRSENRETLEHLTGHRHPGFEDPDRRAPLPPHGYPTAAICQIPGGARHEGPILELSLRGCRIRTDARFPSGIYARAEVEFHAEGLPFRLAGVVQAIEHHRFVAIRFLEMSERKRRQLEHLIEEIEENQEPRDGLKP